MECKELELVVEQEGPAPLPEQARAHVATCPRCREFVADLTAIVFAAHELPAELEPPASVWVCLQSQLEIEGIIKTPEVPAYRGRSSWWHGFGDVFRSRTLATATVGLLIIAAGVLQLRQTSQPPSLAPSGLGWQVPFRQTAKALNDQEVDMRNMQLASTSPVDDSYRQSLQQVDDFIADCERRVKAAPEDDLAREYLSNAYQQKAELLSAMMDREGSVH
jgi:anti-sigma factor RsiW